MKALPQGQMSNHISRPAGSLMAMPMALNWQGMNG